MSVGFDITIPAAYTENELELRLEVRAAQGENGETLFIMDDYKGDKYRVVVFEDRGPNEPGVYYEARGFDSGNEILNYIITLSK